MQIVQELCKRPGLNKAGFEMLTIFIPTLQEKVIFLIIKILVINFFFSRRQDV